MIIDIADLTEIVAQVKHEGQTTFDAVIECLQFLRANRPAITNIKRIDVETRNEKVSVKVYVAKDEGIGG